MKTKEVINRISYFRTQKNLSSRELSTMIGKSGTYINKLECIDFNLPVSVLLEILEVLEVSPSEFFDKDYRNYAEKERFLDLVTDLVSELPREKMINFIDYVKSKK